MVVAKTAPAVDPEILRAARLISRAALFSGLRASRIVDLAQHAFVQTLDPGDLLFRQGDRGNSLYVLGEGRIRLFVEGPGGEASTLSIVEPPASFGELSVFDRQPRSASAEALEHSEVVGIPGRALRDAYLADPSLAEALLSSLAALVRSATSQRSTMAFWDLHGRVARELLGMADAHGDDTVYLDAHASTLAARAGGSNGAVNRILVQLERDGFISRRGLTVELVDRAALAGFVDRTSPADGCVDGFSQPVPSGRP